MSQTTEKMLQTNEKTITRSVNLVKKKSQTCKESDKVVKKVTNL